MKRGLLLIVLMVFGYNIGLSQEYRVIIKNYKYDVFLNDPGCESRNNVIWIRAIYSDGTYQEIYAPPGDGSAEVSVSEVELKNVRLSKKPIELHFYAFVKEKKGRNSCGGDWERVDTRIPIGNDGCVSGHFYDPPDFPRQASIKVDFDYEVYPIISLLQPNLNEYGNNTVGYDEPFTLSVSRNSKGFYPKSVYNWQYQIGNAPTESGWKNLYTGYQKESFSLNLSQEFSPAVINQRINFRIKQCNGITTNSIYYTIRKSAPKILKQYTESIPSTCYDSSDASAKIYFNRQVDPGEIISCVLYDKNYTAGDLGLPNPIYIPTRNIDNINAFEKDPVNGRYYLLIENIPSSTDYRFEIIGFGSETAFEDENGDELHFPNSGYEGEQAAILFTQGDNYVQDLFIQPPDPVDFSVLKKSDVLCFGNNEGSIRLTASGGNESGYSYYLKRDNSKYHDWTAFSNQKTHTISGLPSGKYTIQIKDNNNCIARLKEEDPNGIKDFVLGSVKEITIDIEQPVAVLIASSIPEQKMDPKAFGFTDGQLSLRIMGGTVPYNVEWTDDNGKIYAGGAVSALPEGGYSQTLNAISEGVYTALITDKNGCVVSVTDTLSQPDPLKVGFSIENQISCNTGNTENLSKTEDGRLKAVGSGGVGKYIFTWKKLDNGVWKTLHKSPTPATESIYPTIFSTGIGAGTYAVNIKDENGIVIGEYVNNILHKITDEEFVFKEPDPMVIAIDSENVFCKGGNNAWIEASVIGGTLKKGEDYSYQWSTGETTRRIENLIVGEYILTVTDSNGCFEIVSVNIEEPDEELQIQLFSHKQPKANGLTDGYIQYKITGGTPAMDRSYNYEWTDDSGNNLNTKVTDSIGAEGYFIKLNNIGKGSYFVTITDANYSRTTSNIACITSTDYLLDEPDPLELTVEETKVISCNALNDYGNPFSDGAITAYAKGGVQLQPTVNNGLPYYYTWKKKDVQGVWQDLTTQMDSIAINLDAGEYAVNIKDANGVVLGTYGIDNQLKEEIDTLYTLEEPPLLEISTTQQNVYCFAGSDAWAEVHITGGTAPYTVAWSNGDTTERATELSAGTYEVHVIDSRGCEAITEVIINEPEAPVAISYPQYNRPTHIGANDAWIEAVVTGGTPSNDGSYRYFWKNEEGKLLNDQTNAEVVNNTFVIRLNTITAGTYYLTVQDRNYEIATTKAGCTYADSEYIIYEPIEAVIEIDKPISCNTNNEYQDPFSDGALVAHIEGGVPFETGLPYIYNWKKQNESGVWEDLTDQLDSIAINLNDGNYALNVEDSRGTVMGTYMSDNLLKTTDSTFYFKEPDLLEVSLTTTEVNCDAGNDGSAKVHITGGIPPYDIKWSNGETSGEVTNLIGGTYFVYVTDSRGCEVTANVVVAQPGGLQLDTVTQKNPTCFEGNDGAISVNVTGGIPPYEFQWNTGAITNSISDLSAGKYTLRITDGQGCIAYKEVVLNDPDPVYVNLGEDRWLCNGQEALFDVTIEDSEASYYWESDNGFTSTDPKVTLAKEGIYTVSVTSGLGCIGTDQIEIKQSNVAIDADFLITSQAFVDEEVVLVNVSSPLGEGTQWHVPDGVTIVSESNEAAILRFKEVGPYEVRLRTIEGDCYQDYTKQIVVEEPTDLYDVGEAEQPFLKKFVVHPNPSFGNFTVEIQLSETADLALRMINLLTASVSDTRIMINRDNYSESYSVSVASGVYILLLETPKGNEVRRVVIK